ncbi:MAG: OmpA family protein [Chitinivibrionales bacterium]|nr:OmpA family protein [Chitinivibrionales bacterium]
MKPLTLYLTASALLFVGTANLFFLRRRKAASITPPVAEALQSITSTGPYPESGEKSNGTPPYTHLLSLNFAVGGKKIYPTQKREISTALSSLGNKINAVFIIDGYTDSIGANVVNNDLLATLRSFSVYEHLIESGILKEKIFLRSFGLQPSESSVSAKRKVDIYVAERGIHEH